MLAMYSQNVSDVIQSFSDLPNLYPGGADRAILAGMRSYLYIVQGGTQFPKVLASNRVVIFSVLEFVYSSHTLDPRGPNMSSPLGDKQKQVSSILNISLDSSIQNERKICYIFYKNLYTFFTVYGWTYFPNNITCNVVNNILFIIYFYD